MVVVLFRCDDCDIEMERTPWARLCPYCQTKLVRVQVELSAKHSCGECSSCHVFALEKTISLVHCHIGLWPQGGQVRTVRGALSTFRVCEHFEDSGGEE